MAEGLRQRNIKKGVKKNGRPRYTKTYGGEIGGSFKGYGLAISANAKANYALSQLNTEKKVIETSGTPTQVGGTVTLLNALAQGTAVNQRVGQSVRFTSLSLRVAFANTNAETIWMRYLLVRDDAPNGAIATVGQILQNGNSVQSFRNLDYTKRFKILEDKVLTLPEASSTIGYPGSGFNNIFLDLENMQGRIKNKSKSESNYGLSNLGTIADISKGAYYLVLCTSAAANNVTFSYQSRMRYIDN